MRDELQASGRWRITRRLAYIVTPIPVILAMLVVIAPPAGATHYNPSRQFRNAGNNLCLDVPGNQVYNLQRVQQYQCNGTQAQKFWMVHEKNISNGTPSGYYYAFSIRPKANVNFCVDVSGASHADGAKIILWECNGQNNQMWMLFYSGEGQFGSRYELVPVHSWKCLDVPGQSTSWEVQLQQWRCNGTIAQKFYTPSA